MRENCHFGAILYISGSLEGLLDFFDPSTTTPGQALPLPIVGAPNSFWAALTVSSSF
jgi:hypothetical protein